MAHFHRLIIFAFLSFFASSVFAIAPQMRFVGGTPFVKGGWIAWELLYKDACSALPGSYFVSESASGCRANGVGGSSAVLERASASTCSPLVFDGVKCVPLVCVPPKVLDSSQTSCIDFVPSGPTDDQKKCAALAGKSAGAMSAPYVASEGLSSKKYTNLCDPGTASNPLNCGMTVYYDMAVDGVRYGEGKYGGDTCKPGTGDGSSSSDSPTSKGTLPAGAEPNLCGKGSVSGLVNGIKICSPASDRNVTMSGPSSSSSPAGTASSPVSGIPNAPPTATTSSSSVTCTGGSCTTSTTFKDVSGSAVGTSSTTVSQAGFCKENPSAPVCADGADSSFAGVCGEPPKCEGDAVMCAVALADFSTNCKLLEVFKPDEDLERSAKAALDGSDGINTDKMKADAHSSAVSISNFDTGGKGWSRSCPADPVIPIPFGTVHEWTMPLSRLCGPLGVLANAAVGITLLGALIWVIGGSKT